MFRSLVIVAATVILAAGAAACGGPAGKTKEDYLASGKKYSAAGKHAEAVIEYRNALKADPKFGEARYELALAYTRTNEPVKALSEFSRAADLMPDHVEANLRAGQILLISGKFDDAKMRAEKVLTRQPNHVDAVILRAHALAGMQDLATAVKEVNETIKADPANARSYLALSALQSKQGRNTDAEETLKHAIEVDPKSANAHLALARLYWTTNRAPEAEALLRRALEIDPRNAAGHRGLAMYYMSVNRAPEAEAPLKTLTGIQKDVESRLALADYYRFQGRAAEAATILNAVAQQKDGFAPATIRLALLAKEQRQPGQAQRLIDTVLAKDPKNVEALIVRGGFLMAEGKADAALAAAKAALAADARAAGAHVLLGTLLAARGDIDEAIGALTDALKLNPRMVVAKRQLAELHLQNGAAESAVQLSEEALRESPANADTRLLLARALTRSKGGLRRAEDELKAVLADMPRSAAAHSDMGKVLLAKGDEAGARREFDLALSLDPADVDAVRGRVVLDLKQGQGARARQLLEERLRVEPRNARLMVIAAKMHATGGDLAQAEAMLRRAIEADPTHIAAYAPLAAVYVRLRKLDDAKREFERLVARRPNADGARTMIGIILEAQQRRDEARKIYQEVLALNPRSPVAANNLAWLYAEAGEKLDEALNLAQTAKRSLLDSAEVNDTLGWVYVKKDLPKLAIGPLQASVNGAPDNAVYRFHLGVALTRSGERAQAEKQLREALRLKSPYPEAQDALRKLGGTAATGG